MQSLIFNFVFVVTMPLRWGVVTSYIHDHLEWLNCLRGAVRWITIKFLFAIERFFFCSKFNKKLNWSLDDSIIWITYSNNGSLIQDV